MTAGDVPRPPGRGPKVRAAVLAATLAELASGGYATLTIDNVARRAGVHKTTIYRRWPNRERLVADVLGEHITTDFTIPDTGCLADDLLALARSFVAWVTSPPGRMIFTAIYRDAARFAEIDEVRRDLFEYGPRRAKQVVERAVQRGELPAGTDPVAVIRTLIAPIHFQLTVVSEAVDDHTAQQAADVALAAARAGVFHRPHHR
ncbi:TetR/AcrR family transcriptional regulator [Kribbella sp.]|uniref:TetR/AcrR family transcriptional regulator n=1 Tax=Kribbella sp. TaxID=1871183 RepID=UPI002D6200AE|nr:TetR/AcrR family transcriptional regulator [Kribbella sp.]HZX02802.1 TetR/AcrR family transcriptional regulator [Kribbella sp.]